MNPRPKISAEGLPRRRFTVGDVERMAATGLIGEDERVELIGGDLIPMSPKGARHEVLKAALLRLWYRAAPDDVDLVPETTLRLDATTYLEPDVCVYPRAPGLARLDPTSVLLLVEIADSSLGFDLGRKPELYAAFGIRELWVIDAIRRVVHVHREPRSKGYAEVTICPGEATLEPAFAPSAFRLRLADLDLGSDE